MSLLLFFFLMEYMSRILKCMSDLPDFKFHSMCKGLWLTYLVFADDLIIFCKGDLKSVTRMIESLNNISETSGLITNMEKLSIYVAGVSENIQAKLLENRFPG